jgi:dTDP-4-dehydrorhamnose reductase
MPGANSRVLVLGARGMLGRSICDALEGECRLTAWDIEDLDLTDRDGVLEAISHIAPQEVINCAAFTDVDGAESREAEAMAVNGLAPGFIAAGCTAVGARMVHISTDYVFDGRADRDYTEEDRPNPQSIYGRSKLAGELEIITSGCRHVIVRTQWLYGEGGRNFVETILKLASERDTFKVVNDQFGRPTWTKELAPAVAQLLETDAEGLFHLAAGGACSWFDVAVEIVRIKRLDVSVEPVPTSAFPRPAPRPARAVLDCGKIKRELGIEMRQWKEALQEYLSER